MNEWMNEWMNIIWMNIIYSGLYITFEINNSRTVLYKHEYKFSACRWAGLKATKTTAPPPPWRFNGGPLRGWWGCAGSIYSYGWPGVGGSSQESTSSDRIWREPRGPPPTTLASIQPTLYQRLVFRLSVCLSVCLSVRGGSRMAASPR